MNIYFSGINGTGIGPLALLASDAGFKVFGSDLSQGAIYNDILESGAIFEIGAQDGKFLQKIHDQHGIDWFVYTSALPAAHPELVLAQKLGIKTTKRDDLMNHIIKEKNLQLIAIAGTHGKTTTTAMTVWAFQQLGLPLSYVVGTTLPFAKSGHFDPNSKFIAYECDEYDRNFLKFHPEISLITSISYDHVDIYPTKADYEQAFDQFMKQSKLNICYNQDCGGIDDVLGKDGLLHLIDKDKKDFGGIKLAGLHNRQNAYLVYALLTDHLNIDEKSANNSLASFPGSNRRFEKLADGLYTDYAHHPDEIAATIQMAKELSDKVAVVYQPHQNTRQHQIKDDYREAFVDADKLFWLPTYLTREDASLATLQPADFMKSLANKQIAEASFLDQNLLENIAKLRAQGYLVLLLAAGPADDWLRSHLSQLK